MGTDKKSEKKDITIMPPLNLPPHSIRAILAIIVVLGAVIGCFITRSFDQLDNFAMMAMGLYFASRARNKTAS